MPQVVMNYAGLETIVVAHGQPQISVVILHGYAMSSAVFAPFADSLGVRGTFYVPEAPNPVLPAGRSWWPLDPIHRAARIARREFDLVNEYPAGRLNARLQLTSLCKEIRQSNPAIPLVVCGFSQGGMLACDAVICGDLQIDGLVLLSSSRIAINDWLPARHRLLNLPVLISHGRSDMEIAFSAGEGLCDFVTGSHARVTWIPFDGAHETPLLAWRAVRTFLRQIAS